MRFFHLSDLHIGIKLFNRDLYEDQQYIFEQIVTAAAKEQPDAVVIAGDIYDRAIPSAEAVEVFDQLILQLRKAVPSAHLMLISGNHDSAPRVNVFRTLLQNQNIHMIGEPPKLANTHIEKVVLQDEFGPVNFYLLPFVKPSIVKAIVGSDEDGNNLSYDETLHKLIENENVEQTQRNVLVSHQFYIPVNTAADSIERMDSEVYTVGIIDSVRADILEHFDYAALGHIHKPMKLGNERYRYCGTPLAYSVSEAGQQKSIHMVELGEKGELCVECLPLEPLRQVRVITGTLEEVLSQSCLDYVSVTLTDTIDLDVIDMQDRMRCAFPNLLEIRREVLRTVDYKVKAITDADLDTFELCTAFLKDLNDAEKTLLSDVINTVRGVEA